MAEFASKGVAGAGLGTGIAGLALGVLNGGLGNLLGGYGGCSENQFVNRYELEMENKLVSKDSEIALLKSNIYTDQKITDVFERLSTRIRGVEDQVSAQAVYNATQTATLGCIQAQIAQLQGLTKLIVPIANVCPTPMEAKNAWVAPTSTATA